VPELTQSADRQFQQFSVFNHSIRAKFSQLQSESFAWIVCSHALNTALQSDYRSCDSLSLHDQSNDGM